MNADLLVVGGVVGTVGAILGWAFGRRPQQADPYVVTPKPAIVYPGGRNWVGLTTAEDVSDEDAAVAFARLQTLISEGKHVEVVAGTSVEWVKGSAVHKRFRVA